MNPKIAELLNQLEDIRSGNAEKSIQSQLDAIATEQTGRPSHMNERGTIFTATDDGGYLVSGAAGTIRLSWDDVRTLAVTTTANGRIRYYYAWDIDTGDRKRRPYRFSAPAVQLAGAKLFDGIQRARDIAQAAALDALKANSYGVEYIGGAGWIAKQNGEWISRGGAMNERTAWDQCRVHMQQQQPTDPNADLKALGYQVIKTGFMSEGLYWCAFSPNKKPICYAAGKFEHFNEADAWKACREYADKQASQ